MIRYALRAVPWGRVGVAAALVAIAMELVSRWPAMWLLQSVAVGLLASAAAWCFDEPAAAVVDTAPRGIGWRTAARGLAVLLLLILWAALVWDARGDLFGRSETIALQGVAAVLLGCAWSAWRRGYGVANPGTAFALAATPFGIVWPLMPTGADLPLFPSAFGSGWDWDVSRVAWQVVGACAVVCLVLAMAEAPWWRVAWRNLRSR